MSVEALFEQVAQQLAAAGGVEQGRIMHAYGLRTNGRFFAFARRGELVVKLPAERVAALLADGTGAPFRSGGTRVLREWVALAPRDAKTCAGYVAEAQTFVEGLPTREVQRT